MVYTRSQRSVSPNSRTKGYGISLDTDPEDQRLPQARGKEAPMLSKPSLTSEPIYQNSRTKSSGISLVVESEVPRLQKAHIPKALREQVWIQYYGSVFHNKCPTRWCQNRVNVFDFQVGHNVPESKGGSTTIDNLVPLCGRCNLSMSNNYTFDEWSATFGSRRRTWVQFFCCFYDCFSSKKE
jgi:hypothetical protein